MRTLYPKALAENHLSLSIFDLYKSRLLATGNQIRWTWLKNHSSLATISLWIRNDSILIAGNSIMITTVNLTHTACNYGGTRPWFKCPACRQRVGKLYLANGIFRCRICHNLTYKSCQASRNHLMQLLLHGQRIKKKLFEKKLLNSKRVLIARPKGMHSSTYTKLQKAFFRSERCLSQAIYCQMDLIQKKIHQANAHH
ncbi:hypothetical protein [Thermicanus aegyptius]|uniref:hypothetical protein n=1 Tax=Thermicanus aegyptius TaxID=94009 RepID=UPI0012EB830A|nr:hypothetical protein [Thermicanus aegyptius]